MGQPVPMEPDMLEPSLVNPIRYLEFFTPPVVAMLNLAVVSVAAVVVPSVQPVKSLSKPGLVIRLVLSNLNLRLLSVRVSPICWARAVKPVTRKRKKKIERSRVFLMMVIV